MHLKRHLVLPRKREGQYLNRIRIEEQPFEKEKFAEFKGRHYGAQTQITIKIGKKKTRVDAIGFDEYGNLIIEEYKSSKGARLTKNQTKVAELLEHEDAYVVGKGKGIFTRGYRIPAGTKINVIRPGM